MRRVIDVTDSCADFVFNQSRIISLFWNLDDFDGYGIPAGDLSVAFIDRETMASIHGKFLYDPTPTDVMTFDGDDFMGFAGEIVICPSYALECCRAFGTTLDSEIKLYLVHGYLHLAGLEDVSDADILEMRAAEAKCLAYLNAVMAPAKDWDLIKYTGS